MRHAIQGKQLNRDISSRRALFKNLMLALIEHGKIKTTIAKAKSVKSEFEKLITKAKVGDVHNRRMIDRVINTRSSVNKLVEVIAPAIKRTSGYTRIVKLGNRRGDDSLMVRLEILDWQPVIKEVVKKAPINSKKIKEEVNTEKPNLSSIKSETEIDVKAKQKVSTNVPKRVPQKRIAGGGK